MIKDQPFLYAAGIWEKMQGKKGKTFYTFLLLTRSVQHKLVKRIPYLLQDGTHRRWLTPEPIDETYFEQMPHFSMENLLIDPLG